MKVQEIETRPAKGRRAAARAGGPACVWYTMIVLTLRMIAV